MTILTLFVMGVFLYVVFKWTWHIANKEEESRIKTEKYIKEKYKKAISDIFERRQK